MMRVEDRQTGQEEERAGANSRLHSTLKKVFLVYSEVSLRELLENSAMIELLLRDGRLCLNTTTSQPSVGAEGSRFKP